MAQHPFQKSRQKGGRSLSKPLPPSPSVSSLRRLSRAFIPAKTEVRDFAYPESTGKSLNDLMDNTKVTPNLAPLAKGTSSPPIEDAAAGSDWPLPRSSASMNEYRRQLERTGDENESESSWTPINPLQDKHETWKRSRAHLEN